ncbi:MAG: GatB/YqeY domain-containing protein [Pseudomonadota bacterium]
MSQSLKERVNADVKTALKAGDKTGATTLRLILAAIKQIEVDQRIELDEAGENDVLAKLAKQRRESIEQYDQAGRSDLADKERVELEVISNYLPEALGTEAIEAAIAEAIEKTGAASIKDMGKVMGALASLKGRADMGEVSGLVKAKLNS